MIHGIYVIAFSPGPVFVAIVEWYFDSRYDV